ncbi:MAG: Hpt domain-containing protein [Nitrospinaceae bacterium]|nr:Hpt domain-containing protein [Nitrospinaceae bacterium]NIR53537.1 Hpt domain-containing protein [Nitrospinaceae bacterium]NIS83938.1 Hpt domain-containing protein [Nitrospinaceae bacterium]NIT80747.1 Hpt domain-containing protein [Nitrospinaceae bacterium]NIU43053.1 Hpt domain-containing protein [Nitrospinaceae bacterium]
MNESRSKSEKIRVHIDPDLKELIPGYLENRKQEIAVYQQALEHGDYDSIAVLGHSMKGSGGGYGFNHLSVLGKEIEQAAKHKNDDSIRRSIAALSDYLNKIEVVYD